MKARVFLDSSLPKTSRVPVTESGDIDYGLIGRLVDLSMEYSYSSGEERRAEIKAEFDSLRAGVRFEERPHFVEYTIMGGEFSGIPKDLPQMIGCHPETWAMASDEMKEKYEVIPERESAGAWINFKTPQQ